MSIRVTCNKCHARFNVSDKFAGQTGPCPKCKTPIKIPTASEKVTIAAPISSGPVDSTGQAIVKPIKRKETKLTTLQLILIGAGIVGFFVICIMMKSFIPEAIDVPYWLLGIGAILLAVPLVYSGYGFLRDPDLESFKGQELGARIGICCGVFALTWSALPIAYWTFNNNYEVGSYVLAGTAMLVAGGVTSMFCFEFDFFIGVVHYGLYMALGLMGRFLAGIGALPKNLVDPNLPEHLRELTNLDMGAIIWQFTDLLGVLVLQLLATK